MISHQGHQRKQVTRRCRGGGRTLFLAPDVLDPLKRAAHSHEPLRALDVAT